MMLAILHSFAVTSMEGVPMKLQGSFQNLLFPKDAPDKHRKATVLVLTSKPTAQSNLLRLCSKNCKALELHAAGCFSRFFQPPIFQIPSEQLSFIKVTALHAEHVT